MRNDGKDERGEFPPFVFLLPITPRAPFSHASSVPSSACDPNKDDWARVSHLAAKFGEVRGEAVVLQSQARWGLALSKLLFRHTVSSILRGQCNQSQ